ncbi:MAG: helix-turn-helix domain-containing protein [Gammaproteobacteria bacterium]|jgi:transcriptional regulator with XRE-family HTH domain|nr:MAG: helix-turn-helix domain-containing protein [Gammaproteobacteria bacterium]
MIVRKLRLQRGWSQSQLAEMAGVTSRTIQRIEQGQKSSLETSKALASVFEVDLSIFQPEEETMIKESNLKDDELEAMLYAKRIKEFYEFLIGYLSCAAVFLMAFHGHPLIYIVLGFVGVGLIIQGLIAFEVIGFFGPNWEKKLIEKKLGRKL